MLPLIVQHSETLVTFVLALDLALYQPQIRHLLQIVDAILAGDGRKTMSDLARRWKSRPDPKGLADFFRESPWTVDLLDKPRQKFMVLKALELARKAGLLRRVMVGLDEIAWGRKGVLGKGSLTLLRMFLLNFSLHRFLHGFIHRDACHHQTDAPPFPPQIRRFKICMQILIRLVGFGEGDRRSGGAETV